ncbi:3-phosphoglycerate dehydrogenase [Tenacibaculum holothuriorum]|uniref:3-phosphoglycerate dehydrogenase n=1 Tax=Tenacibaculum holothuriorum TaxID=1635173 RepID=A0A1Y2PHA9_9FLAO|nr:NAD(P)-dependent oxidoreductase [Tenacibaculum holothuriorum]OSY89177.1 3-phosphoglycerate dehydrogenase [Tenacibaculum holothuriorum]
MKILANEGISESGKSTLENAGFEVLVTKVAQNQLENFINENSIDAILIGNNTEISADLIDECQSIKLIGTSGSNTDNIDVDYAEQNGIHVIKTSEASSVAIAELVFAHLFGMTRHLHQSNREMPLEGDLSFNSLKKQFANGIELRGKTLGLIGINDASIEVAKIGLGIGMNVIAFDTEITEQFITISFYNGQAIDIALDIKPFNELLETADFISIHTKLEEGYVIDANEIEAMKNGVGLVNTTHSALNEVALISAIESGKVQFAGLDVFENQPTPEIQLLMNPELSLSPNIGTSTKESKEKVGNELAEQIINLLNE